MREKGRPALPLFQVARNFDLQKIWQAATLHPIFKKNHNVHSLFFFQHNIRYDTYWIFRVQQANFEVNWNCSFFKSYILHLQFQHFNCEMQMTNSQVWDPARCSFIWLGVAHILEKGVSPIFWNIYFRNWSVTKINVKNIKNMRMSIRKRYED